MKNEASSIYFDFDITDYNFISYFSTEFLTIK